jgi:hypothetical protein
LLLTLSYNNNAYVVESVDFAQNPLSTFSYRRRGAGKDAEEVQISYAQYVLDNHKVKIQDVKQPLLRSSGRNKQKIFLVPELCLITDMYAHWRCLVWFGLVWFGLVWFGLVWFGLV